MTIGEIIERHHQELLKMVKRRDVVISCNKTPMDVFQDVMVTAIQKYKEDDINEAEGVAYLRKAVAMAMKFQYNKKDGKEVLIDDSDCNLDDYLYEIDKDE